MFNVFYFSLLPVVVIYVALAVSLNRRLWAHHSEVWIKQGSPSFWNNSPANSMRFVKLFIFSSEYRALNDPLLTKCAILARILFIIGSVLFVGLVFAVFTNSR